MGENNQGNEQKPNFDLNTKEGRAAWIEYINKQYGSPEERALPIVAKLQDILKNDSIWDSVLVCTMFLGTVSELVGIQSEVIELGKKVYAKHYFELDHTTLPPIKR